MEESHLQGTKEQTQGTQFVHNSDGLGALKHRIACVFENASQNIQEVNRAVNIESSFWCLVGAS
jgi:hypothetical protein